MIKLLFYLFRKRFLVMAFDFYKVKPNVLAKMEFAFVDSNGKKYFKYVNENSIHSIRWWEFQLNIASMKFGMDRDEDHLRWDQVGAALRHPKGVDIPAIGHAYHEIQLRKKHLPASHVLVEIIGCWLVREDQDPTIWDDVLEQEKIAQYKKDIQSGVLDDFFGLITLEDYFPYLNSIKKELPDLLQEMDEAKKELDEKVSRYISEVNSLISESK